MSHRTALELLGVAVVGLIAVPARGQNVKYEKYKLDNGMTVILHEDHALPVGAINFWYRVGSKDEPQRRSGFAHLFEHLMFMGTGRVPGNKFDTIMESGGGSNNASTSSDRTNYFSSGPAALLPTLLWLDADRLEDLGRAMDQEKLDKQRDIVRNERRQSYENRPYGKAELQIQEMMFPPGHPYHIPVIGTHEDLEAATVTDVKDFFATFYVPNNVTLCVAGDFDPKAIKPLIADLFGSLPRKPEPKRSTAEAVKLDGVKRATLNDKVQLPLIAMGFHSPRWYAEGDAEMDLVGAILSRGKTSRLYKRLVYDDKIAADVAAYQDSGELGSTFRIDVHTKPEADLDVVEKAIDEEVARLIKDGPKPEELEQRKAEYELRMLSGLQSVEAKADQLNEYDYIWGEPNSFKRDLDRYRSATVDGVRQWAEKVLTPNARVIMRVLPEKVEQAAGATEQGGAADKGEKPKDAAAAPAPKVEAGAAKTAADGAASKASAEATPRPASARDKQPPPGTSPKFNPPSPETFKLSNGVQVMLWPKTELPLVAMTIVFMRSGYVINDTERPGTMWITADMLDEGTGDLDALQFSDAVQSLGARFNTSADHDYVSASLTVLKRNLEGAAELAVSAVRKPKLAFEDFDRVRKLHLEELKRQDDQPTIVASRVATRMLYGVNHRYGWPIGGTSQTVSAMNFEEMQLQYATLIRPEYATVLIAGDVTAKEARTMLEPTLGSWNIPPLGNAERPTIKVPQRDGLEVVLVDRPQAVQTVIQFGMPGPKYGDDKRVQYRLLNTLLGGSFTSRLNMNLREEHGFTYGARSRFAMRKDTGYLTASSNVRADVTGASVKEFLKEFERIRKGDIADEEAAKARETLRTDVIQSFQGLNGIIGEGLERIVNGLPFETLGGDVEAMQSVGAAQLNTLGSSAIPLEKGVVVLVGDKKTVLEQIKDLNLPPPIEVDIYGKKLEEKKPGS